jgi:predicted RNA-binding Zn ribbon-like protein
MRVAIGLVNDLIVMPSAAPGDAVADLLAFDPTSVADRPAEHAAEFTELAQRLHEVVLGLHEGRVDDAAAMLNELLASAPAVPHLAKEDGHWPLHHHPHGAGLVEAWKSICAEALARLVGEGGEGRVHLCAAADCRQAFVDTTKNATRRYCSERCQNRVKAAALRHRRARTR